MVRAIPFDVSLQRRFTRLNLQHIGNTGCHDSLHKNKDITCLLVFSNIFKDDVLRTKNVKP